MSYDLVQRASLKFWAGIAISSNGQYQSAISDYIYISSDFGVTWNQRGFLSTLRRGIAMSADGVYQTVVLSGGQIYTSDDHGNSWVARDSNRYWDFVSMSADGQYQTATAGRWDTTGTDNRDYIYTSSDYGVTWTPRSVKKAWRHVSVSSTGQYQTAYHEFELLHTAPNIDGYIYTSSDYGVTWVKVPLLYCYQDIVVSASGQYQTAIAANSEFEPVSSWGFLYQSSDYGVTWSRLYNYPTNQLAYCIAMSFTGQYQALVIASGGVRISDDYGATWTVNPTGINGWSDIAMTYDGTGISIAPQFNGSGSVPDYIYEGYCIKNLLIDVSSTWKTVTNGYVKKTGAWRPIANSELAISGSWKELA